MNMNNRNNPECIYLVSSEEDNPLPTISNILMGISVFLKAREERKKRKSNDYKDR